MLKSTGARRAGTVNKKGMAMTEAVGRVFRNIYYYDPKKLDLQKLQEEALRTSQNRDRFSRPQHVTIHFHDHDEACQGRKHEDYPVQD